MNDLLIKEEKEKYFLQHLHYLESNGSLLKLILHDYMNALLLFQPEDVLSHSREYFSTLGRVSVVEDIENVDTEIMAQPIDSSQYELKQSEGEVRYSTIHMPISTSNHKGNVQYSTIPSQDFHSDCEVSDQVSYTRVTKSPYQNSDDLRHAYGDAFILARNDIAQIPIQSHPQDFSPSNEVYDNLVPNIHIESPSETNLGSLESLAVSIVESLPSGADEDDDIIFPLDSPCTAMSTLDSETYHLVQERRDFSKIPPSLLPRASDFSSQLLSLEIPLMESEVNLSGLKDLYCQTGMTEPTIQALSRHSVSDLISQFQAQLNVSSMRNERKINRKNELLESIDLLVLNKVLEKKDTTPFYELMQTKEVDVLLDSFLNQKTGNTPMLSIPYLYIDEFKIILFRELKALCGKNSLYTALVAFTVDMTLPLIADSDALYHDVELVIQTVMLTTSVINALTIRNSEVNIQYWTHVVVAILCSHVGMCIGALNDDIPIENLFSTTIEGAPLVAKSKGQSNAILIPHRIKRSQKFIDEKFIHSQTLDRNLLKALVASTSFPFSFKSPEEFFSDDIFANLNSKELGMCRLVCGCDTIAPICLTDAYKRLPRMYHEMEEANELVSFEKFGINSLCAFRRQFFDLYWRTSSPFIVDIIELLSLTQNGQVWKSQLFGNVFECFHGVLVPSSFSKKHFSKWASIIK